MQYIYISYTCTQIYWVNQVQSDIIWYRMHFFMLFVWFLILLLARQRKNSSLCSKGDVLLASGAPRCVSRIDSVSSWLIPSSIIRFSNRMKELFNLLYLKFSLNMSLSIYIYMSYISIYVFRVLMGKAQWVCLCRHRDEETYLCLGSLRENATYPKVAMGWLGCWFREDGGRSCLLDQCWTLTFWGILGYTLKGFQE